MLHRGQVDQRRVRGRGRGVSRRGRVRDRNRHGGDLGHRSRLQGSRSHGEGHPERDLSIGPGIVRPRGLFRPGLDLDAIRKTLPGTQNVLLANGCRQRRLHLALTRSVAKGKDGAVLLVATGIRALVDGLLQHIGLPCLDEIPVVSVSCT